MNSKEILIFDISSEYGHFRKYNTTTSPLTYSIPTRTAIAGMLGAILGMEREIADGVYPEGVIPVQEFFGKANCDIAVQILNPVKKENIAMNLINTAGAREHFYNLSKAGRTQIEFELLKEPRFRTFLSMKDLETQQKLAERIRLKKHHFSPYLGLAQFTATIEFVELTTAESIQHNGDDFVEIISAVNLSKVVGDQPVAFDYSAMYSANNMPIEMNSLREVQEYSEILIERNGHPVKVKVMEYYLVKGHGNILFL